MRIASIAYAGKRGLAAQLNDGTLKALSRESRNYPGDLIDLISQGREAVDRGYASILDGEEVEPSDVEMLPLIDRPGKIICVGLNYRDHTQETGYEQPDYPTFFTRVNSSLIGCGAPLVRPKISPQFDFEGELVAIIGKTGRNIPKSSALDLVAGYSIFNDASVRDFQFKTSQWTIGKNFDGTGAFGPFFVSQDMLPKGCQGLTIETRLNGTVVQRANISDMVFDVATQISILSESLTLQPGDVIVTGTPAGVGFARTPQLWMKPGDVCEVEIEDVGVLRNEVRDE
jgi:acylpyruvate hydrolase